MNEAVPPSWEDALMPALASPEVRALHDRLLAEERAGRMLYPPRGIRLRAFALTPLDRVKVVVLGQDPYHGPGQATGLAFGVPDGVKLPPSLVNIYTELESDCGIPRADTGNLEPWARQGVLLLNTALTVEAGKAGSHAGWGWEGVTDAAIRAVAEREVPTVFLLWGSHAQAKARAIPRVADGPHLVVASPHPSPLSAYRGFFGSRPFSRANRFLERHGRGSVDWRVSHDRNGDR